MNQQQKTLILDALKEGYCCAKEFQRLVTGVISEDSISALAIRAAIKELEAMPTTEEV